MIKKMYSIYDSKAEFFYPPMHFLTNGEALRQFVDLANDPQTNICRHPADHSLFEIGEYNNLTAHCTMLPVKINLGLAIEYKNKSEQISLPLTKHEEAPTLKQVQ